MPAAVAMPQDPATEIKTMKLYTHVDRIERRLCALGYTSPEAVVDPEKLATIDTLHYFGDEPARRVLALVDQHLAGKSARVLDIGTGYGGIARLLAHRGQCHVDALELQSDLSAAGLALTQRCGLSKRVRHVTGDFLQIKDDDAQLHGSYDVLMGIMCFMHIGHWPELFARCHARLEDGGLLYVEDFFLRGVAFSDEEERILKKDVYVSELYTREKLLTLLDRCGFEVIEFQDVTTKWRPYVIERARTYHAQLNQHAEQDGEAAAASLDHFYSSVATLFEKGNVGGYTLVARRRAQM
ncbi:TPA: hypothetical protein N0F65_006074 [Lagenidium giganteum]|uniref:Uncharacterized protein n=1 Tax=Lagenidium giganteum TaxID=4803 RepID=A0AAV2YQJ8_9STRA|nr:TPA: hypothetical protein N0F65_006074 [Lagenidium giganteum]